MKRILIIAILISYSIASFGVSLNYFYCCGKLKDVSIGANAEIKSNSAKPNKGCCENKTVTLKLNTDQKSSVQAMFNFAAPLSPDLLPSYGDEIVNIATNGNVIQLYKRPPPATLLSRSILFCVFRI